MLLRISSFISSEYPDGAQRLAVRFQLGVAMRSANQLLPARITWSDLDHDIERKKPAETSKAIADIRADASL